MLKISQEQINQLERKHHGISDTIYAIDNKELPCCPICGSADTAQVSAGAAVNYEQCVAAATTKIKLLLNGRPAPFFCNSCKQFFKNIK